MGCASGSVRRDALLPEASPSLVVGGSEDEPLVFAGPPGELTGRIHLHNPSDAKVVLRDAGLKDPSGTLRLSSARHALAPVVLRPDQGGSVPLSLAVHPATPPGEHTAELDLGGRTREVVLHVAEVFDLTVVPVSLVVANRLAETLTKQLIVTNDGNVAFTLADPGTVPLRDDLALDRVRRLAIEPLLGPEKPDLEALIVALLAVVHQEDARLGDLEVRIGGGPVELQPGETKDVTLEITLQDELPISGRYRGRVPVLTRNVDVIVVASGGPVQETGEDAAPKRRRRRAADAEKPARRGAAGAKKPARRGAKS